MRRKARWVVVGLAVILLVAADFVLWPQSSPSRITRANCERLCRRMSRADIEAILGPPGDYTSHPIREVDLQLVCGPAECLAAWKNSGSEALLWQDNDTIVTVRIHPPEGMMYYSCWETIGVRQTAYENIVWRINRQWRKWFP
jgi:hypothetical protein